jgi:hypothetical protein
MDEVSFGPGRESRRPSRRRAFVVAVALAGTVAGAALALTATGRERATSSPSGDGSPAALAASPASLPPSGCPPVRPQRPSLAGLPAGMRPGALTVVIDAQFSGQCPAP